MLTIDHYFSKLDLPQPKYVDVEVSGINGEIIFKQDNVETCENWNDNATRTAASKYFYGKHGEGDRETSVYDLVSRVTETIGNWGFEGGYFDNENSNVFVKELESMMLNQYGMFNSPVLFNFGNPYATLQAGSACFINKVEDNIESITKLVDTEAKIFRHGSGSGVNLSSVRSSKEEVSGGGMASGILSWEEIYDRNARSWKSGGRVRRAARMRILSCYHGDILTVRKEDNKLGPGFAVVKGNEEDIKQSLINSGYSGGMDGEATAHVQHQSANFSVLVDNAFMEAVEDDTEIELRKVTPNTINKQHPDGDVIEKVKAREIWDAICETAWRCGDPGIIFGEKVEEGNTCKSSGVIRSGNPCQPGFATVLTEQGIKTFDDITIGSLIWSGHNWTKVTNKLHTGIKKVYKYKTTSGEFIGTEDHKIIQNGERVSVKNAETIDVSYGSYINKVGRLDQDVIDGLVIGDGMVHKASNNLVLLCIGESDERIDNFLTRDRSKLSPFTYEVNTSITAEELPKTYNRVIPERFYHSNSRTMSGFLRGLFSANGSVVDNGNRVTLKATSEILIRQVQVMLSAMGIRSYITINKPTLVQHKNGQYKSKQSYDLNITTHRTRFMDIIGFIQTYKCEKVNRDTRSYDIYTTSPVVEVEYIGEFDVYDITVEDSSHTYWTGGCLVSNCNEFLWHDNGSCNLASLNLLKFYDGENFDWLSFCKAVSLFTIALDIITGNSEYPTKDIADSAKKYRTIGLGYTNLGALLLANGFPYDSEDGRNLAASITSTMTAYAYKTSSILAEELGAFPAFNENKKHMYQVIRKHALESKSKKIKDLYSNMLEDNLEFRNAQVTCLAPAGTISFVMGCETTGVEPYISFGALKYLAGGGTVEYDYPNLRTGLLKVIGCEDEDKAKEIDEIIYWLKENGSITNLHCSNMKEVYELLQTAIDSQGNTISPSGHIEMLSAVQPHLSGGISKTVNVSEEYTKDDISNLYFDAWRKGLKSVALYRDGSKSDQPVVMKNKKGEKEVDVIKYLEAVPDRKRLPIERPSITRKFDLEGHDFYVTCSWYPDTKKIAEVYIRTSKEGTLVSGSCDAIATVISIALQYGVPLEKLVDKMRGMTFGPGGFTGQEDIPSVKSFVDAVFQWLELKQAELLGEKVEEKTKNTGNSCPKCGTIMVRTGICETCPSCGESGGCG